MSKWSLEALVGNAPLMCAIVAWLAAQVLKTITAWLLDRKLDWRRLFGLGGMPSSHAAFVFAMTMKIVLLEGFGSVSFAVSFALMAIVITDAMGVRRETGRQGKVLNEMLREIIIEGKPITEERLKELVGHSPLEVLGGVLVGLAVSLLY